MVLPTPFTTTSPQIASYDFTDVAEGTGIQKFFLVGAEISTGADNILTENAIYSRSIHFGAVGAGTPKHDLDFDLSPFHLAKDMEGTGYVNIAIGARNNSDTGTIFVVAKIRKWDGTSETEIATATSETTTITQSADFNYMVSMPITIPYQHFEAGEILRVTVQITTTDATLYSSIGFDPINRSYTITGGGAATLSASSVYIPFKI